MTRYHWSFSKAVMKELGNVKVSRSLICMVRKGLRTNEAVMNAIIITQEKLKLNTRN